MNTIVFLGKKTPCFKMTDGLLRSGKRYLWKFTFTTTDTKWEFSAWSDEQKYDMKWNANLIEVRRVPRKPWELIFDNGAKVLASAFFEALPEMERVGNELQLHRELKEIETAQPAKSVTPDRSAMRAGLLLPPSAFPDGAFSGMTEDDFELVNALVTLKDKKGKLLSFDKVAATHYEGRVTGEALRKSKNKLVEKFPALATVFKTRKGKSKLSSADVGLKKSATASDDDSDDQMTERERRLYQSRQATAEDVVQSGGRVTKSPRKVGN